jgi:hypothetical protein
MAVTVDAVSNDATTSGASVSWSHTCGATANCLVVCEGNAAGGGGITPTGVTYNGVALTLIPGGSSIGGTFFETSVWFLLNPPTGAAHTVTVNLPVSQGLIGGGAISLIGVDTTTPHGTAAINSGSADPQNVTAVGGGANDLYVGTVHLFFVNYNSTGVNQTQRCSQINIGTSTSFSVDTIPGSSPVAFTWSIGGTAVQYAASAVVFLAASGGSSFPPVPGSPNAMPGFQQHNALMVN